MDLQEFMESQEYKEWWQLHLRAAKGEELSPEERARYESRLAQLDADEKIGGGIEELRRLREKVAALKRQCWELANRLTD